MAVFLGQVFGADLDRVFLRIPTVRTFVISTMPLHAPAISATLFALAVASAVSGPNKREGRGDFVAS